MIGGITLRWTDQASRTRRVRFEPRAPGGWDRRVEEWDGDRWRPVGDEIVADLELEVGPGALDVVDLIEEQLGETVRGPEEVTR